MSKKQLLIFPYNGNGLEALDCLGDKFEFVGFIDDTPEKQGVNQYGHRVWGRNALQEMPDAQVLAVPGSPASFQTRDQIIEGLGLAQDRWATVIHQSAQVSQQAQIGKNVLIMANTVICGNAHIGDHCVILPLSVVHHDSSVGAYSLIGSGVVITGYSHVGKSCYIGSRTSISNYVHIADKTLVGIGSNVLKSILEPSVMVGNPAKPLVK